MHFKSILFNHFSINQTTLYIALLLWSASVNHSFLPTRHLGYFTIGTRIAPRTTLLTMQWQCHLYLQFHVDYYIISFKFDLYRQQNTTNHVCNAIFVFAIIVQSHVPITLFLVNGAVKLIPVAIHLFQQTGLEISIRFHQTFVSHRIVMHVHVQMNTQVNDYFFQVFLYRLIHHTPGFLPKCGTMLRIQITIKL